MTDGVWVVGVSDAESSSIASVHRTKAGALVVWNDIRLGLISDWTKIANDTLYHSEMWMRMIRNLENPDPDTLENYPHETPYIMYYEVIE